MLHVACPLCIVVCAVFSAVVFLTAPGVFHVVVLPSVPETVYVPLFLFFFLYLNSSCIF